MKNFVFWIGVKPDDERITNKYRYGDFSWMDYSKKTWEYWCIKNNVKFIHYDKPSRDDYLKYKINWQRWLDVFYYIPEYDSILLVDASIMVRWDAPNYFKVGKDNFCAVRADENWKWTYESANGYTELFPDVNFIYKDYFGSGFVLFQKKHEELIKDFGKFYLDNLDDILMIEDEIVKRGRDQPVLNYFVQKYKIPIKFWSIDMMVSHLYRRNILGNNWQLKDDSTPFFIKYFYGWAFSGFPDRGETRSRLMSQTWELIKDNYV